MTYMYFSTASENNYLKQKALTFISSSKKDFAATSETGVYCLVMISPYTSPL